MTLGEIIYLARLRLDDRQLPYLWSDADLTDFANAAQLEACERARFLMSTEVIPVIAGDTSVTLTATPAHILDLTFDSVEGHALYPIIQSKAEFFLCKKGGLPTGTTIVAAYGDKPNVIDLFPGFLYDGTLTVNFSRNPTEDEVMVSASDEPVIPAIFHRQLVYWMLYEAFSLRDMDSNDAKRASAAEQNFTKAFGPRPSAKLYTHERRTIIGARMYPRTLGS